MSRKEVAFIVLMVIGALALFTWQIYRMSLHHLGMPSAEPDALTASDTTQ